MAEEKEQQSDLDRRRFLTYAAVGAAATVALPLVVTRAEAQDPAAGVAPFELDEATLDDLQGAIAAGRQTAMSLTQAYLARIDAVDKSGPALNAVIEVNPDAAAIADMLDREWREKGARGPLHGIPVLIKDNIDTADRMRTSAGSLALVESIALHDAFIVRRLRDAGAVILGKTNLSEWANFRSTHSTSGWSGRGGQTRNPYILDRNPCGSSSGSGAGISASLAAVAVGTETDGSIVCPAATNGIVGIKPTLGLISRTGIIPIAHSQDTAGPMARTVRDAAILLGVLAGIDSADAITSDSRGKAAPDYTKFLDPNGLKGARIGVARKSFGFNDKVDAVMSDAIDVIRKLGATIVDPADMTTSGKYDDTEMTVLLYEFKADLNVYLEKTGPKVHARTLKQLIEFNEANKDSEMPFFGQELFLQAEAKGPLTTAEYKKALEKNRRLSRAEGIDAVIAKNRLDALIAPTNGPAWPTDHVNGDHFAGGFSSASAVAGYPHITVPAGFVFGLPVGISFFAGAWSEPALIKFAYAFEQATKARKAPKFRRTAEV